MRNRLIGGLLATTLLVFHQSTSAEDIDLFVQPSPSSTELPNVLFIIDNTGNWTPPFTNEIAALKDTFNSLPADKFRVGIIFSDETGGGDNSVKGGYVRAAIRKMDSTNKGLYATMINALDVGKDKGNAGVAALAMAEAYRYLSAGTPYAGNGKAKTDFTGNIGSDWSASATSAPSLAAMKTIYALSGNALASKNATQYNNPITSGCQKNYIIYLSNGPAQDANATTTQATSMLTAAGGSTTAIPVSPSGSQDNVADEWARFMKKSSLGVVTYTVDVNPGASGQGPGWTALLKSMASVSSGKYFAVSSSTGSEISDALKKIFSEIQDVNSVFASVALPASVNTEGTFLNQIFIGMFRPDADAFPRWAGNLKQYKLGLSGTVLSLEDANGNDAVNNNTGFITECARSYWTPTTTDTYWSFQPQGGCLTVANSDSSNYPDGNIVEKGAQAYKLRSTTSRTVETCSATSCTGLTNFDNSIAPSLFGSTVTTTERDALVKWETGLDLPTDSFAIGDENNNGITLTEMRPSAHGDVIHSRPVAINFGTDVAPQVVVFYGGNDGILRAINGNRDGGLSISGKGPGMELWAFVAPEFYTFSSPATYSSVKRLRENTTQISFKGSTIAGALPKPYGVDGPITAYQDASHTWIFAPMRRGGRAFYAFDVTTPASPSLKWKKSYTDTGFSGMGQTWSSAKSLKASGFGGGNSPLLIMGGGYDTCEDGDPNTCTTTTGNQIYVLDANNGNLQATLNTDRAVTGDVFVLTDTSTGLAKWAYVADLGGNIYRISGADANTPFASTAPGSWTITKIASLGCDTTASCTANRKFMFAPDIVDNKDGTFSLLIGSGDREKPLKDFTSAYAEQNYFFMVEDKPTSATWLSSESGNCGGVNVICKNSLGPVSFGCPTDLTQAATGPVTGTPTAKGWALQLCPHEQVVTSGITVFGVTTFSTHIPAAPAAGACTSNLGTARAYNINFSNATSAFGDSPFEVVTGGGLSPSPVAGMVTLDNGQTVPFVIGGGPTTFTPHSPPPPSTSTRPKGRVYWFIQQ